VHSMALEFNRVVRDFRPGHSNAHPKGEREGQRKGEDSGWCKPRVDPS
jgi:hypothetical protein